MFMSHFEFLLTILDTGGQRPISTSGLDHLLSTQEQYRKLMGEDATNISSR